MAAFSAESPDLEDEGPVIEVQLWPVKAARDVIVAAGDPLPAPITLSALIDTGASGTAVKAGMLAPLKLNPVGTTLVNTPTSQNHPCSLYAVQLSMPNGYVDITVIEAPLEGQNIQVLIGRDVLKYGILIYQGHSSQFTLCF